MQSGHQQHVCERRTDPQVPGGVVVAQAPRRVQDVERAQLARDAVVAGYVKDTNVTIGSGDLVPCAPWVVVVVVGGGVGPSYAESFPLPGLAELWIHRGRGKHAILLHVVCLISAEVGGLPFEHLRLHFAIQHAAQRRIIPD